MHYVKQFNINGVDTKQVACIELQGKPNASTEGCVGVLGIDVLSPNHEVYKCVARNGGVYKWELLSAGTSIISAKISGEGGEAKSFPYTSLLMPDNYIIKVGDLILDSGGYLYQIKALGVSDCIANYCGTQIGGIATGDRNCVLRIINGRLELVTESGNVVSSLEYLLPDYDTVYRDSATGKIIMTGIKTINDTVLRFFVGTKDEYNSLSEEQKINLFALITDDDAKAEFDAMKTNVQGFIDGTKKVKKAESADSATKATQDGDGKVIKDTYAKTSDLTSATGTKVARAMSADSATKATNADYATFSDYATSADSATKATQDGDGKVIKDTYQKKGDPVKSSVVGEYTLESGGKALSTFLESGTYCFQYRSNNKDAMGNNIETSCILSIVNQDAYRSFSVALLNKNIARFIYEKTSTGRSQLELSIMSIVDNGSLAGGITASWATATNENGTLKIIRLGTLD